MKYENFYDRINNFYVNITTEQALMYEKLLNLSELKEKLASEITEGKITNGVTILEMVFRDVFQNIEKSFNISNCPEELRRYIYDACSLTALIHFINKTKKIKERQSLSEFVYKTSPLRYDKEDSPNYCPRDYVSDGVINEVNTLRKARHRILSKRPGYYKKNEWKAMPEDSETEWALYYSLHRGMSTGADKKTQEMLCDTYKRIKNLYNNIVMERATVENIVEMREKDIEFKSRLKKIKYENYLKLIKVIMDHISSDKINYGINIYRLERSLRPCILNKEIKAIMNSHDLSDKTYILRKTEKLSNVWFPKLYQYMFDLSDLKEIKHCLYQYEVMLHVMIIPVNLVLDEFIDCNFFGDEWKNLFLKTINERAKDVFYTPNEIDYSIEPDSQKIFEELLEYPVIYKQFYEELYDDSYSPSSNITPQESSEELLKNPNTNEIHWEYEEMNDDFYCFDEIYDDNESQEKFKGLLRYPSGTFVEDEE